MADNNKPYFVTSKNFHGDNDYVEWLKTPQNAIKNGAYPFSGFGLR